VDSDVPEAPSFGLLPIGKGSLELRGIGFEDLAHTKSVSSATLRLNYVDEIEDWEGVELSEDVAADSEFLPFPDGTDFRPEDLLCAGAEIMKIAEEWIPDSTGVKVVRGQHGTPAAAHPEGRKVFRLKSKVFIIPLMRELFGSPASGEFAYPVLAPDIRIASAELFVTNSKGNSETTRSSFAHLAGGGVRTLSGGQVIFQVDGYLAVQSNAVPRVIVERSHAVRDVVAVLNEASLTGRTVLEIRQGSHPYCGLVIEAGESMSTPVAGTALGPLLAGRQLELDVLEVGSGDSTPARDLSVAIRL
jgi:hypothetical protein